MIRTTANVDYSDFERTVEEYARVTGKTIDDAAWRALKNWALKAWKHHRSAVPRAAAKADIDRILPKGKRGSRDQWRLVSYLARKGGKKLRGKGSLTAFARKERTSRNRSTGYLAHLLMGIKKAADARGAVRHNGGILGEARRYGGGLSQTVSVEASSRYRYKSGVTRAGVPRSVAGIGALAEAAFAATLAEQVADMEAYIARKLSEAR